MQRQEWIGRKNPALDVMRNNGPGRIMPIEIQGRGGEIITADQGATEFDIPAFLVKEFFNGDMPHWFRP